MGWVGRYYEASQCCELCANAIEILWIFIGCLRFAAFTPSSQPYVRRFIIPAPGRRCHSRNVKHIVNFANRRLRPSLAAEIGHVGTLMDSCRKNTARVLTSNHSTGRSIEPDALSCLSTDHNGGRLKGGRIGDVCFLSTRQRPLKRFDCVNAPTM